MADVNNRIAELVRKLQSGDKSAFEELYRLTSPKAYFVALKICKNEHDAEDILQESYIKALEKIDTVDPEGNFTAWLYQIVANKSKNFIKAKKPLLFSDENEETIGELPDEDLQFSPEEQVDQEDLRNEVMAAVDELTEEKRACVMMMYFGDMSVNEIAQSLEVPVSTVKNRLFTARKDLKSKFEKKGITALYSAAPLGAVIWAIGKTSETTAAAFAASAASSAVMTGITSAAASSAVTAGTASSAAAVSSAAASASTAATTAAATGTGIAAKVAAFSVAQKVVAGIAAVSVIGGSTAGVVTVVKNNTDSETTTLTEEVTTAPSQTEDYAFAVITTEESTTDFSSETDPSATEYEPTATTSKRAEKETSAENKTQTSTTLRALSSTTTTKKQTTTPKATTTTTKRQTTTQEETTEEEITSTTKAATTQTTAPATETTTQATTKESTSPAPATVIVEVTDMNEAVVDTLALTVPDGTEMTYEHLVALIKENGHEPKAGIYGDAVGAVAESGKTYKITAEL